MSAWTCRQFAGKAAQKIVPPHPRIPCWKGLRADSEEKREPVSGINAGVVDSLKVLDPKRPIREAVITPITSKSLSRGRSRPTSNVFRKDAQVGVVGSFCTFGFGIHLRS